MADGTRFIERPSDAHALNPSLLGRGRCYLVDAEKPAAPMYYPRNLTGDVPRVATSYSGASPAGCVPVRLVGR